MIISKNNSSQCLIRQSVVLTLPLPPGEIPELFSEEEMEGVVAGVRAEVRGLGLPDTRENCWRFFIDRVRLQLKVKSFRSSLQSQYFCPLHSFALV